MGKKLTADPSLGLAHLYHPERFTHGPCVELKGDPHSHTVNGWYQHREASEGPPRVRAKYIRSSRRKWIRSTGGRPWFEKDDGCYIFWLSICGEWNCCDGDGLLRYCAKGEPALPPAEGWRPVFDGKVPAPTLRVVS